MNKQPLISVLMPAYNAEEFISEAISSILLQTYTNFELIISDDASTDNTKRIIDDFLKQDARIKFQINEKNLYIAGNRNKLLSLAQGEFIAWADADDVSVPQRLEWQIAMFLGNSKLGICGGYLKIFSQHNLQKAFIRKYPSKNEDALKKIFRYSSVAQPAAMIRRSVFEKVGLYNLDAPVAEDIEMLFRIARYFELGNVQDVVLLYRDHIQSATYDKLREIEKITLKVRFEQMKTAYLKPTILDYLYNIAHWLSLWIIPSKMKMKIFCAWRNQKA